MGYSTSYTLEYSNAIDRPDHDFIDDLREECDDARFALDDGGETGEPCNWYDHEKDMIAFSVKSPGVLFTLTGHGEEKGDIWTKYFRSGAMQVSRAKITFDECAI